MAVIMTRASARLLKPAAAIALASAIGLATMGSGEAQPEPSFTSTCRDLRASVRKLNATEESLITIQVVGRLTSVQSDEALVYITMCSPPDPQVLCITYGTNGRKAGDTVVLAGTFSQRGPNHILLDPCLHFQPEQPSK